jgi:hypothetical protein
MALKRLCLFIQKELCVSYDTVNSHSCPKGLSPLDFSNACAECLFLSKNWNFQYTSHELQASVRRLMAKMVIFLFVTVEVRVRCRANSSKILGDKVALGKVFL